MLAASLVVANVLAVSMVQLTGRALPVCHRTPRLRAGILVACDGEGEEAVEDLNWLQTRLQVALAHEDYAEAATIRDRIRRQAGATSGTAGEAAWATLGVPDWLADRLERLDFQLPTRVQMHALRATESGDDAAVCAPTGSGKTLAYLLPLLAALSDDLLSEDLSGFLGCALGRRDRPPDRPPRHPDFRSARPAACQPASPAAGRARERRPRVGVRPARIIAGGRVRRRPSSQRAHSRPVPSAGRSSTGADRRAVAMRSARRGGARSPAAPTTASRRSRRCACRHPRS